MLAEAAHQRKNVWAWQEWPGAERVRCEGIPAGIRDLTQWVTVERCLRWRLDNEYSIWHSTDRDVWPTGATMEQVRDSMIAYSGAIKNADPAALVVGPEEWGWSVR